MSTYTHWSQHRVTPHGAAPPILVDPATLLAELTPETRVTLDGFIDEYRGFIMRERSWRRRWSRPERGIDVELAFLNEDMKAAVAAWTAGDKLYQMAIMLPGYDAAVEAALVARVRPSLSVNLEEALQATSDRPAVLVIPIADAPEAIRPVLQTDLLTLPSAFFALAAEADRALRDLSE